jgi:hypothetical protein
MLYQKHGVLSIWVGEFESAADLEEYITFVYDENDESSSPFAEDSGLFWFDHDLQEAVWFERPLLQMPDILNPFSWSGSYKDAVWAALQEVDFARPNSVFILFETAYDPERAVPEPDTKLVFIGVFPYDSGKVNIE